MNKELIMVRYGELVTKGKNRSDFIKALYHNIKRMLKKFKTLTYEVKRDHIYIELHEENYEEIKPILKNVSGLASFSLVYKLEKKKHLKLKQNVLIKHFLYIVMI